VPEVLLIGVPGGRALSIEQRLTRVGCRVRRVVGWPDDPGVAMGADALLAETSNPAALALAVRRMSAAPLVIITDDGMANRVAALSCGADVCLAANEADSVIEAHLLALLRRREAKAMGETGRLRLGGLSLDPSSREADVEGAPVEFRPREFDLLLALMRSPGRAFRRHELLDLVWGPRFTGGANTVDVHVSWIRQKLPQAARVRITTLRGVGYRLDELSRQPVAQAAAGPVPSDPAQVPTAPRD
jgi:DNA-binding response OmpR family regulator